MSVVNHPNHYKKSGRRECIVEIQERFGTYVTIIFCLTNAYKYLYRAGEKENNPKAQDIEKARWYYDYAMKICHGVTLSGQELRLLQYIRMELRKYG